MSVSRIRDYGDRALLLEFGSTDEVLACAAVLRAADITGVTDIVPGARTVLVTLTDPTYQAATRIRLATVECTFQAVPVPPGHADVVIDVIYDGADLDDVAALVGMDTDGVVAAHTGTPWRVAFGGFAPGFAYLIGGDSRLSVPRRDEPRTRVPAGSVALAGEFSGVYPRESPGGWQLIGRTETALWDIDRPQPALLAPGMWVRFRAVTSP
ncbi:allophanate hydrolase subunit 1 [Mycolicibacterium sp.]|uniref:5-oxoprolinase subunit B family protein n=1 Tax=Mycolicibacterium sp. TaxID=2320850 RepID=UPI001A1AD8A8|nr:allophanate hydrolase subunit 1 [Mycolicibacterium sp.]MBJ7399516.1 allophanate hydrolase subunit 1 [Mycolicibacterium sp.]